MTREDTAALSLRLLAIYVLFQAVEHCLGMVQFVLVWRNQRPGSEPIWGMGLAVALLIAFGIALFAAAPDIAKRIFPGSGSAGTASPPEFGVLALKLCGFVMLSEFVLGLHELPDFLRASEDEWRRSAKDAELLVLALHGVGAAVLIRAAPWLARRLFAAGPAGAGSALLERIQPVAFSVLGLWIAGPALLAAGHEVAQSLYVTNEWDAWRLGSQIATAVLGVTLFVGSGALARFWRWMQVAGLSRHAPS